MKIYVIAASACYFWDSNACGAHFCNILASFCNQENFPLGCGLFKITAAGTDSNNKQREQLIITTWLNFLPFFFSNLFFSVNAWKEACVKPQLSQVWPEAQHGHEWGLGQKRLYSHIFGKIMKVWNIASTQMASVKWIVLHK